MIILRHKNYSSIYNVDGKLMNGATDNVKRSQSYYDSIDWESPAATSGATKIGSNAGIRTKGGQTRYDNEIKIGDIYDMGVKKGQATGFQQGKNSVGIKQGAINTWNKMSTGQQIATGAVAGTALVGATALALRNRRKRKEAEEELELERARNRRRG